MRTRYLLFAVVFLGPCAPGADLVSDICHPAPNATLKAIYDVGESGRLYEAAQQARARTMDRSEADSPADRIALFYYLSVVEWEIGKQKESIGSAEQALQLLDTSGIRCPHLEKNVLKRLVYLYAHTGKHKLADRILLRLRSRTEFCAADCTGSVADKQIQAKIASAAGRFQEAEALYLNAIATLQKAGDLRKVVNAENSLGVLYGQWRRHEAAARTFEQSLARFPVGVPEQYDRLLVLVLTNHAHSRQKTRHPASARESIERAMTICERFQQTESSTYERLLDVYADVLRALGDKNAAKAAKGRAASLREMAARSAEWQTIHWAQLNRK